jgi:hypothetical protein
MPNIFKPLVSFSWNFYGIQVDEVYSTYVCLNSHTWFLKIIALVKSVQNSEITRSVLNQYV